MNKWKQEGQLKKYSSGSSVITHIMKSQERFLHFTSHLAFSHIIRAGLTGGETGQLPRALRSKGAPRDDIYLFQIKYSFEKLS